ncbi:acyl-CoA/acyl-ACP dehydrogenase [Bradyrhizobium sp. 138]|uniref:acyl-CoA dehydrogenase family protein n=1 Tax=Bradyrhizobium sp. 138 TaxID=2782615 RepID=UPI001FF8C0CD|nr:acyl-CoA dehydrogenase family protein [Bradyrhizobium sp. 138]MCK1734037.1 acyl-CoA/acyl-ACP dehydrogenase [Bradyrhizobium sp. 138]
MDFYHQYDAQLSADERDHVAKARAFCAGAFSASVFAAHMTGEAFPEKWIAEWAALGMLGLQAKRAHGGLEASYLCKIRVAQEMARHGFAAAFCLNHHQGGATRLSQTGTPVQIERLLQPALRGELLLTTAMTEPAGGSDVSALTTTAVPVDGGWALSGTKAWMTDGLLVGGLIVLARVGDAAGAGDIASFYVPFGEAETVKRTEIVVPGARSFRLAEVAFDAHFIPEWCLIAAPGAALKASMASVNAARVHVAAMCVATLHAALCEAVDYCEGRQAFGKPLIGHQGLRWELAEVSVRLEAANALVFRAAEQIQIGGNPVALAAQAKKFAVDTALWGIDQCVRIVGATGAGAAHRLNMHFAEVRMAAYADGTNEMLLDRVGRGLSATYPKFIP